MKITDDAVRAGAMAWDKNMGDRYGIDAVLELSEEVRVILEAAIPHLGRP